MSLAYTICLKDIEAKVAKKQRNRKKIIQKQLFDTSPYTNTSKILNDFGEDIVKVDGDIPINLDFQAGERFLFISYDQSYLTHGLHKYPAKFFPELPRWLIRRYSKQHDLILDPFSGSGTTNIEALLAKRYSVGIDIDPFSRFISKVKTTPLNIEELNQIQKQLLPSILNYKKSAVQEQDIPSFPYQDSWFTSDITLELAYIRKTIESLECSLDIKNFFKVCFSSIIRSVSNADNNCTRTVIRKKLNKQVFAGDALKKFVEAVLGNIPKVIDFSQNYPTGFEPTFPSDMDARNIKYKDEYFDLAITSPPYVNAVDYPRTHQLEIYWLGFYKGSLTPLKKRHIGTESVSSKDYKELHKIGISEADQVLLNIYEQDPRRSYIAFKYLEDMRENLREVYRVLKDGGRYIIVVGNNTMRGNIFESWKYLMQLAENIGFSVETYFGSEIIRHYIKVPREERINTDWIIVLRK